MKNMVLLLAFIFGLSATANAAISISCGKSGDFNEDTYSYEPEFFAIGAPEDHFDGVLGVDWDASVRGKNLRDKQMGDQGTKKVSLTEVRDENGNLEKLQLIFARTNSKNLRTGTLYLIENPYFDEPTLKVYSMRQAKPLVLKATLPCVSSMD